MATHWFAVFLWKTANHWKSVKPSIQFREKRSFSMKRSNPCIFPVEKKHEPQNFLHVFRWKNARNFGTAATPAFFSDEKNARKACSPPNDDSTPDGGSLNEIEGGPHLKLDNLLWCSLYSLIDISFFTMEKKLRALGQTLDTTVFKSRPIFHFFCLFFDQTTKCTNFLLFHSVGYPILLFSWGWSIHL